MPIVEDSFFRNREDIVADMIAQLQAAIPDVYVGDDGVISIIFTIQAGQLENAFLANQLVLEDMFIQTASLQALRQYGEMFNVALKDGTRSIGTVTFTGDGGTYIPINTEIAYDPGEGLEPVYFLTTTDGTIPNPGTPSAPVAAVNATAGNLTGSYEYAVSFVTTQGETLQSLDSNAVSPSGQQVNLTNIPIGGPGVIARRIYRDKNGSGTYRRVTEIANNTATTYTDNVSDATVAANPLAPTVATAQQVTVNAQAEESGVGGNIIAGAITELTNAPATLTDVINLAPFTGGSDPEDTEAYRQRLLQRIQNPFTGSPTDIEAWAEEVAGVESATVFTNDNLGTPTNGHVTIRVIGPGGSIPPTSVLDAVAAAIAARDMANATIHVASFTDVPTTATVDVTTQTGFSLADVTPGVQKAVSDYINSLDVGETMRISRIIDAAINVPGVIDVTVTSPGSNQTTAASSKRTASPSSITVT